MAVRTEDVEFFVKPQTMQRLRFRTNSDWLEIDPKGGEVSYSVSVGTAQKVETQDHDPPPPPKNVRNILHQLRDRYRREMGVIREAFDDEGFMASRYVLDEDEGYEFEEEIMDRRRQEAADKAADVPLGEEQEPVEIPRTKRGDKPAPQPTENKEE